MRSSTTNPPPIKKPQGRTQDVQVLPAPTAGLDTVSPLANMAPVACIECENIISSDAGLAIRDGWWEYATHIADGAPIKTIFSHNEAPPNATQTPINESELFAATDDGIFLIEGGGDFAGIAPMMVLSGTEGAGRLSTVMFVNDGAHFTIACSETDGGFIYDGVSWIKMSSTGGPGPGIITGVDPSTFVQVCVYKKRLVFVTRQSSVAWILDVGALGGAAKKFDFGPNLQNGGFLLALINWTQDAGAGIDDRLVVLGSAGDLAVYQGNDPTSATDFANVGIWYVGQPPIGRRCFTSSGGNVYILTQYGLIPVSQIVQGGLDNVLTSTTDMLRQLRMMSGQFTKDFNVFLDTEGWEVLNVPGESFMHITRPHTGADYTQYAFEMHTLAWSAIKDIPANTFGLRLSELYGGTFDGRILRLYDGHTDGEKLDGTGKQYIRAKLTPAFNYFGAPALQKQCMMVMPTFLSGAKPVYALRMNADFHISNLNITPIESQSLGSFWDQAYWDQARWGSSYESFAEWRGVTCDFGYCLTPTLFISAHTKTVIASIAYMLRAGGVM